MEKRIAIIGGGIVGATAAYYLSTLPGSEQTRVTLFDDGTGQPPASFRPGCPNAVISAGTDWLRPAQRYFPN